MTTLIYGIVFILLITILITIGNLVFSISEINDRESKQDKQYIFKVIKIAVFVLIKIVLFALIINLIMFSFFGNELDLNNLQTQILTIFVSFQIITESISINRLMRGTVKALNSQKKPIIKYIETTSPQTISGNTIKVSKTIWMCSFSLNILTIFYLIVLMSGDFTFFYQNMFIYFLVLVYIKYLTFVTFYGKISINKLFKIN